MASKKNYSRYFIILQEDEKGYALATDKLPSGYVKLEIKNDKCKISFYVQNLKKQMGPYCMVLICGKKDVKKVLKLGELNIDDHGRAEKTFECSGDNIMSLGINTDKVIGASIMKFVDVNRVSVMNGFSCTNIPTDWKNYELLEEKKTRNVEETSPKIVKNIKPSVFDDYEKSIKSEEKEDGKLSNEKEKHEEVKREEVKCEEIKHEEEIKRENHEDLSNDEESRKDKEKDKEKGKDKESMQDFFMSLVEDLEEMKDVCPEIKKCKWYKVAQGKLDNTQDALNYNKYTVIYYPMMNYSGYIRDKGHYLFGYKHDKDGGIKYLVYGIPGTKRKEDQPYGGRYGFVTWVPKHMESDEDGYWLMFYDFRNSTIVIPMK